MSGVGVNFMVNSRLVGSLFKSSTSQRDCASIISINEAILFDNHDAFNKDKSTTERHSEGATLSAEETQDRMDQFTYIMQEKVMLGEDHQHLDYSKFDEDETLDGHWQGRLVRMLKRSTLMMFSLNR
ncbi:hypothetical protein RHMOL_Rhmol11G0007900 [Rhododendron molle]|uniref:Uncharacterized protein n=1 Tax=Rhododendron molle TaxID=49168 RepID=A0ACC0LNG4_RHOML|nr:hypothetical protein RHMOL_Rhmol11G0007900 [Rhododendron molle]